MRKLVALMLVALLAAPAAALAATSIEDLQKQIQELTEELEYVSSRVDKAERHTATDRISFYGDLRVKADSLHYQDLTNYMGMAVDFDKSLDTLTAPFTEMVAPGMGLSNLAGTAPDMATAMMMIDNFKAMDPTFNALLSDKPYSQAFTQAFAGYLTGQKIGNQGFSPAGKPDTRDLNNDLVYTTRLRLGMKSKVAKNVNFSGRLSMYKNWGDSTGAKVFDSWSSFTMDGTNGGNTSGDWLRVERAYFDWKNIGGSNFYLSIGRRPSTYGPPSQYRENEMRGGTPSGHLVHFNFDGITAGYKLSEITGVEGQTVRFCYGQGYESEWGNGELFNDIDLQDTQLGGFNIDALNDGTNFLQFTLFGAMDVTDGFKGTLAIPDQFLGMPGLDPAFGTVPGAFPGFQFLTRMQARANIGDMYLGGVGFAREEMNGVNWFTSLGWTRTEPSGDYGVFGGMLSDPVMEMSGYDADGNLLLDSNGDPLVQDAGKLIGNTSRDGFSFYTGVQVPAPMGKLGLEYNFGSKYWTPFTQAQDDLIGSKLATRGHVGEAYYIFDVNPNMFIKLAGIYYDYEYTGSGSPVGLPKKVDDIKDGKTVSMLPVVDTAYDLNASLTIKF